MHRETDIPIISIVGKSNSGKTTVLEGVVSELASRGWRVATVKHHVHDFDIDVPGKDSWRHARAGAVVSMVSSTNKLGVVKQLDCEPTLDDLAIEAGDVDILLTEGYKQTGRVRIEVSRDERSSELVCTPAELFALVTDGQRDAGDVPVFALGDTQDLTDLIETEFLPDSPPSDGRG